MQGTFCTGEKSILQVVSERATSCPPRTPKRPKCSLYSAHDLQYLTVFMMLWTVDETVKLVLKIDASDVYTAPVTFKWIGTSPTFQYIPIFLSLFSPTSSFCNNLLPWLTCHLLCESDKVDLQYEGPQHALEACTVHNPRSPYMKLSNVLRWAANDNFFANVGPSWIQMTLSYF